MSQSTKHYHITRAATYRPRLEIDTFAQDTTVLNMYLLAYAKIQSMDQSELTSFFSDWRCVS